MKKLVHNIQIRVFEKNPKRIDITKSGLNELLPVDFKKEKISIDHEKAEGFNEKTINIISIKTSKKRHNRMLLNNIFNKMDEKDKKRMYNERKTRIDTEGNFYIRLDKESLLNKKYRLTEGGNCYHLTIKLAAYPVNKKNILNSLDKLFRDKGVN